MNSKKKYKFSIIHPIRCPHCMMPADWLEFPESGELPCYNCGNPILQEEVEKNIVASS